MVKKHYIALAGLFVGVALLSGGVAVADASAEKNADAKVRVFVHFDTSPGNSEQATIRAVGGEVRHSYKSVNALAVEVPEQALEGLKNNPHVTLIEEDHVMEATTIEDEYARTWSISTVNADDAHTMIPSVRGTGVKVGVIDSGVDYLHQDLKDQYRGGYDFVQDDYVPLDVYGHGTHVAGTICASLNEVGVVGVAPECDLYSLRVLNDRGSGYESDIVAAIEWAVANDLDVVNLSLGSASAYSLASETVFNNAYTTSGLVIIAAAGNSSVGDPTVANNVIYPAKYASVMAVAATDVNNDWATFSSVGEEVEISAPGVAVLSTYNDNRSPSNPQPYLIDGDYYKLGSGTSMASPHVAGVVVLIIEAMRTSGIANIDASKVRQILRETATDLGADGFDVQYGAGLVDAAAALASIDIVVLDNSAPVANAGVDQVLTDTDGDGDVTFTLDGRASSDDKGVASYVWTDANDDVVGEAASTTSLTMPVGVYTYTLTVTDAEGSYGTDTVKVTISAYVAEPVRCTPGMVKKGLCTYVNTR